MIPSTARILSDPALRAAEAAASAPTDAPPLTRATIPEARARFEAMVPPVSELLAGLPVEAEEHLAPGPDGAPPVAVTLLMPQGHRARLAAGAAPVPGIQGIHGGGMIVGHRRMDVPRLADLVVELGVVAATVEYRLAPEHPHPAPVEDCHAALVWFHGQAAALGVDPARLAVMGGSAGGGLSAGVALLARRRASVALAGQVLLCPMIDDRNVTPSSYGYPDGTTWTRPLNLLGWECLLADTDPVPPEAAPAREGDLSGLPPAFIEVGSAEMFRDEDIDYARRLWWAGVDCELHVWSGGFHGFDVFAPDSALARAARDARRSWLRRTLSIAE